MRIELKTLTFKAKCDAMYVHTHQERRDFHPAVSQEYLCMLFQRVLFLLKRFAYHYRQYFNNISNEFLKTINFITGNKN